MAHSFDSVLEKIPEADREEYRVYLDEYWFNLFNEIMQKLLDTDPKLKSLYEKNPIPWVICEEPDEIGIFFHPGTSLNEQIATRALKKKIATQERQPFFRITRGLINLLRTKDELAFLIGHELEHYYQDAIAKENNKVDVNSHIQETSADIKGMERAAKAGYNIDDALNIFLRIRGVLEKIEKEAQKGMSDDEYSRKKRQIAEYLQNLDPHPQMNARQTIQEGLTTIIRHNLAGGVYHGKEVNANTIKSSELPKEAYRPSTYISFVDEKFKRAKFNSMTTEEKEAFLVEMCYEISQFPRAVRVRDFAKYVNNYLATLEEEMETWSAEEKEQRFKDGTAPAMSLIAKFLDVALFEKPLTGKEMEKLDNLFSNTLAKATNLWPMEVYFKDNAPFWQRLRKEIEVRIENAKKRAKIETDWTEEEDEQDKQDSDFIERLNGLFWIRAGLCNCWKDAPRWDNLEEGDLRPNRWHSITRFEYFGSGGKNVHPLVSAQYDGFIETANGSVCASKVLGVTEGNRSKKRSKRIDKVWASWEEFSAWQEQLVKEHAHKKIADRLHRIKMMGDRYIEGQSTQEIDLSKLSEEEFFGDIYKCVDKLFPYVYMKNPALKARALELDPGLLRYLPRAYLPRAWDEEAFKKELIPIELDKELLFSKMKPEDVEFFSHPQIEYADKLVDACINRIGLKRIIDEDKENGTPKKEVWVFPMAYHDEPNYGPPIFLPHQEEKIIEAFVKKAPATIENVHENKQLIYAYISLADFYLLKNKNERDYNFADLKTPLIGYILQSYNLPDLTAKNAAVWKKFIQKNCQNGVSYPIQCVAFDALLHNSGEELPLDLIKDLILPNGDDRFIRTTHSPGLEDIFRYKIQKLFQNDANIPSDLDEFTDVVHCLQKCGTKVIGYRRKFIPKNSEEERKKEEESKATYMIIKDKLINLVQKESDPKKIENAWLTNGGYFALDAPGKEYDEKILPVFMKSLIWQQDIKSKVEFFVKVPDIFWGSDISIRDHLVEKLLSEVEQIKNPNDRENLLFEFLKKKGRINNGELLARAQHLWAKSVADIMGQEDDESKAYLDKIKPYIDKVKKAAQRGSREDEEETVAKLDQNSILRYLAEETVAQSVLSRIIKPAEFSLRNQTYWDQAKSSAALMGVGGLGTFLKQHPEKRDDLIAFLRSKGSIEDCEKIRKVFEPEFSDLPQEVVKYGLSIPRIQQQYKSFWTSDPNTQMFVMDSILKNTATGLTADVPLWEQNFDYVADQIFPATNKQSRALKAVLHAYLESRPASDRNLALAKLLVSAGTRSDINSEEEANQSIGKGIKAFLESIKPAGIKLGQALYAIPDVPDYIRDELKDFVSNAAPPARWEIYDWLDIYIKQLRQQNRAEEADYLSSLKLKKRCGDASFFTVLFAGDKDVVKILRLAAKVEAEQEMGYIYTALKKVMNGEEDILNNFGPTFLRIVEQAQTSIADETNMDIGKKQYDIATELYPDEVEVNGFRFNVKEAEWKKYGQKWAQLERINGVEIDKLKDPEYKKAAAIAYVSIEFLNILAGGEFDWDRHTGQMKIDAKTNTLGLFDTGSMLLEKPTPEDQSALGVILYRTFENALGSEPSKNFAKALTEEIDDFYRKAEQPSAYVTQVQRGLLALAGYYQNFSVADFAQCLDIAFNNPQVGVSDRIISAFVGEIVQKTGLFQKKATLGRAPEEVAAEKESLGRLLFNLYAASQVSKPDSPMGDVLEEEMKIQKKAKLPILGHIFFKKMDKQKTGKLLGNIKIPSCFCHHIVETLKDKEVDPIIVKGVMKAAFESISLIDRENRDTPEIKRELGRQLYDIFEVAKKKENSQGIIEAEATKRLQVLAGKSVLARNLVAILSLSKTGRSDRKIDFKEVIWDIIGQKELDKDVLKGLQSAMKEKGQKVASLALNLRRPISKVRKIRRVFSLFKKKEKKEPKSYLQELLEQAEADIVSLPEKLIIKKTSKGRFLTLLSEAASERGVPLASENASILYKRRKQSTSDKK